MADIYAFVRKITNHELISARDAKALTDAVDGLIDEINGHQMRINELNETNSALEAELAALDAQLAEKEAENARLRRQEKREHTEAIEHCTVIADMHDHKGDIGKAIRGLGKLPATESTPAPEQRELSAEDEATFDLAFLRSGRKGEATPPEQTVTEAWRPIETAPKDGTWVMLWRGHTNFGCWDPLIIGKWFEWREGDASWVWPDGPYDPYTETGRANADVDIASGYHYKSDEFTHWMPLPTPPMAGGGDA